MAAERDETPEVVARRWAVNLKSALNPQARTAKAVSKTAKPAPEKAKPAPKEVLTFGVPEGELAVPAGETRWMSVTGVAPGTFAVKSDDQQTAVARVVDGKKAVVVAGLAPGKATITVTAWFLACNIGEGPGDWLPAGRRSDLRKESNFCFSTYPLRSALPFNVPA